MSSFRLYLAAISTKVARTVQQQSERGPLPAMICKYYVPYLDPYLTKICTYSIQVGTLCLMYHLPKPAPRRCWWRDMSVPYRMSVPHAFVMPVATPRHASARMYCTVRVHYIPYAWYSSHRDIHTVHTFYLTHTHSHSHILYYTSIHPPPNLVV